MLGDAPGQRYADALGVLLDEREADVILVLNCPTAVADSMKGTGLGYCLMQQILDYARDSCIHQVFADILRENQTMRKMTKEFGFVIHPANDEVDTVTVILNL